MSVAQSIQVWELQALIGFMTFLEKYPTLMRGVFFSKLLAFHLLVQLDRGRILFADADIEQFHND